MKPVEVDVNFLYHFETLEKSQIFYVFKGHKREY